MKPKLIASTIPIKNLSPLEIKKMYDLFSDYYTNHDFPTFERDLKAKDHVIILRDSLDKSLQGFSTLQLIPLIKSGKKAVGVYSGDTVINRKYWGSSVLGVAFLLYLWKQKFLNMGRPVYWFLISKGYKTYLMMAKNFKTFYPRKNHETPREFKKIMDDFYSQKFNKSYQSHSGLIIHEGESCSLKAQVADISEQDLLDSDIEFFQANNPNWQKGDELCCLAEMTSFMPIQYILKKIIR